MTFAPTRPAGVTGQGLPLGEHILLAHGGGGQLTDELLAEAVLPRLTNPVLAALTDAAVLAPLGDQPPMLTLDGYVVQPWRFPGGDIGRLAVCGTVNDLAVSGGEPVALALGLIITEGFARADLNTVLDSVAAAAREAGVAVVTGDTKVVGHGQGDGVVITTAGLGRRWPGAMPDVHRVQGGDVLLINGPIADHGLAVMLARQMPHLVSALRSDVAPLNAMLADLYRELGPDVIFTRDPTRAGVAGVVADLARHSGRHVVLRGPAIPIRPETAHAAELLGLDPLEVANEGKVVVVVRPNVAERALAILRRHAAGAGAAVIGEVVSPADGVCELETQIGGRRVVQKPYGEQLPRIC